MAIAKRLLPAILASADKEVYSSTLNTSLIPERYLSLPTFARSTAATVVDFEGSIRAAKSGEARFYGARRVENLLSAASVKSEDFSSGWSVFGGATVTTNSTAAPDGTLTADTLNATGINSRITTSPVTFSLAAGRTLVFSVWMKSVSGSAISTTSVKITSAAEGLINGGFYGVGLSVDGTWKRFSYTAGPFASGAETTLRFWIVAGDNASAWNSVYVWGAQVEEVSSQTNKNPGEYVSAGVLTTPFHGANVDGVKYFGYQNGNTVTSNIVTEASGAAIASSTMLGVLTEIARTNYCLYSNDMTNAAWVKTNCTAALTAQGVEGGTLSASTLTATGANATCLQSITRTSTVRVTSCYIKRRTGTGTIELTQDNGVTWTKVTVTASWAQVTIPSAAAANPTVGIRIVTSGDAVDVQFFQHEEDSSGATVAAATSPIATTSAPVQRNQDSLQIPAEHFDPAQCSIAVSYYIPSLSGLSTYPYGVGLLRTASAFLLYVNPANNVTTLTSYDGTQAVSATVSSPLTAHRKILLRYKDRNEVFISAQTAYSNTFDGAFGAKTPLFVGGAAAGAADNINGFVRDLKIYLKKVSQKTIDAYFLS